MRVFISWSGEKSKKAAELFRNWIPCVLQAADPYFSPDDIVKGTRWSSEVSSELSISKIGILILTRSNFQAPWVVFEAGALSKNIEKSRVCPILLDIDESDLQGPLVQFQASKFNKQDIKKIMKMINESLGDKSLKQNIFNNVFNKWWPSLEKDVLEIIKIKEVNIVDADAPKIPRPEKEILEELLTLSRNAIKYNEEKNKKLISIVKKELTSIIYDDDYLNKLSNDAKKELWKKITTSIHKDNFPNLSNKIHNGILDNYFPTDKKYYLQNYKRVCKVKWDDAISRIVQTTEEVSVEIIPRSEDEVINHTFTYSAILNKDDYHTNIKLVKLKIGDDDYSDEMIKEVTIVNNKNKIQYSYNIPLQGQPKYILRRKIIKTFSLATDPYSRYYSQTFISGSSIRLEVETKGLRVQFVESGIDKQFKDTWEEKPSDCGKYNSTIDKYYPALLFPKQGYVLHYECE